MGQRDTQHPLAIRADEQRRASGTRAARHQLAVADLVELAGKIDRPLAQQGPDDRERLLEAAHAAIEWETERPVFGLVPARAQPQGQASAADLVDRGGLLGEHGRVVKAGRGHQRPKLDSRCDGRQGSQLGPCLPRASGPLAGLPVEQVVADPQGIEAEFLGARRHGTQLRPADYVFHLG